MCWAGRKWRICGRWRGVCEKGVDEKDLFALVGLAFCFGVGGRSCYGKPGRRRQMGRESLDSSRSFKVGI